LKPISKFEQSLERKRLKDEARDGFLPPGVKENKEVDSPNTDTSTIKDHSEQPNDQKTDKPNPTTLESLSTSPIAESIQYELPVIIMNSTKVESKKNPRRSVVDKSKQDLNVSEQENKKEVQEEVQQYAYRPKIHKREKIHDTHTSQAYMIENELISIVDEIVGDTWGGKYRFVNEAIKLMIYQEFPEYIDRIREKESSPS